MTDTPSSILLQRLQSTGSNTNLWGGYLNTNLQILEQAAKGYQTQALTVALTVTWTNYATGNIGQCLTLKLTGALAAPLNMTLPAYQNGFMVWNASGATVTILTAGGVGVAVPNNRKTWLYCDATDYFSAVPTWLGDVTTLTNAGDIPTYTQVQTLIANASTITSPGQLKNSANDTTSGYLSQKLDQTNTGLLLATWSTETPGGNEKSLLTTDDRRVRRRAMFLALA